jgi:hypothetical protein
MKRPVLLAVLLWPVGAVADLAAGARAFLSGDYATAMREWRPLAEAGNAIAQWGLATMYSDAEGVSLDDREAVKWFRKAAAQEHAAAQTSLGIAYVYGKGVPKDYAVAVKWYRLAAEQGLAPAQYSLGLMYDNGNGVAEDDAVAVKWYRLAAEQGNADAQFNLGTMYSRGKGVAEDYVPAYAWWNLAAAQGDKIASRKKNIIRKIMTPTQIAEAQKLCKSLMQRIRRGESTATATRPQYTVSQTGPWWALVKNIQKSLAILGYQPGSAGGVSGRRTISAVKASQSGLKIAPAGEVAQELLALLQIAVAATKSAQPNQPTTPTQHSSGSGFFVSSEGHFVTNPMSSTAAAR